MRQRLNAGAFLCACCATPPRPGCEAPNSSERATHERLLQQTQNLGGGGRRGAASRRLGMGIRPSRWASFLAAFRARRTASAFSRVPNWERSPVLDTERREFITLLGGAAIFVY